MKPVSPPADPELRDQGAVRVRLVNAKFSPNLGDGLSCECLEKALVECGCAASGTDSIDVAARKSYRTGSGSRGRLLQALHATPAVLRRGFVRLPLAVGLHRTWLPHYRRHLAAADAVVIGGGNLFTDFDLNFPTKLAAAIEEAARRDLAVFIYGVGVGALWSAAGSRLLCEALRQARVAYVGVRDGISQRNFDERFAVAAGRSAEIVRDPGLLISRYVTAVPETARLAGLCVTSAIAVRYHSTCSIGDEELLEWYAGTAAALGRAGYTVRTFTNGSPEDVDFARRLLARMPADPRAPAPILRPADPAELARLVSSCSLIVAFRLHALVAAYSYGVAIIALAWDGKVDAFMKSVDLEDALVSPQATPPRALVDLADRVSSDRVPEARRAGVVDEAMRDVAKLAAAIRGGHT